MFYQELKRGWIETERINCLTFIFICLFVIHKIRENTFYESWNMFTIIQNVSSSTSHKKNTGFLDSETPWFYHINLSTVFHKNFVEY
jgi:hypothetical protein